MYTFLFSILDSLFFFLLDIINILNVLIRNETTIKLYVHYAG